MIETGPIPLPDTAGDAMRFEFGPFDVPPHDVFPNDRFIVNYSWQTDALDGSAQIWFDDVIVDSVPIPEPRALEQVVVILGLGALRRFRRK